MTVKIHKVKCIEPFFSSVWGGFKEFEIRYDDRGYKEGDIVVLRKYNPISKKYLKKYIIILITYIIRGTVCLKERYCAFGFNLTHRGLDYDTEYNKEEMKRIYNGAS